jgi:Leucine-rich repeat (LRR) protein
MTIKFDSHINKLKSIPNSIGKLKNLKELKIKENYWITLPDSLKSKLKNSSIIIEN